MKAYLANALFSESDQMYNSYIAEMIRNTIKGVDLYVPQENPALNDKSGYADSMTIFDGDNHYLDEADILIAVIDGLEIDSGVAAEIGRFLAYKEVGEHAFHTKPRYVYALYTDVRQQGRGNQQKVDALVADGTENQFFYRNLYVIGGIKKHGKILDSIENLCEELERYHG